MSDASTQGDDGVAPGPVPTSSPSSADAVSASDPACPLASPSPVASAAMSPPSPGAGSPPRAGAVSPSPTPSATTVPTSAWLCVICGVLLLFATGIGTRPYGCRDVTRYAQMVLEMHHQQTLVPTIEGRSYHEAAPLAAWGPYAVSLLTGGTSPFAVRVLSSLSAIGMALLSLGLGLGISTRVGLWAGAVCALNHLMVLYGRSSRVDALLGFGATLAIASGYLGTLQKNRRAYAWFALAGVGCALAIAAKGPYGGALVAAALVPFWLWEKRWRAIFLGGPVMLAVGCGLTAAWLVPYLRYLGPDESKLFFDQFFLRETLAKFESGYGKAQPVWTYLVEVPPKLLPWSLLAIAALIRIVKRPGKARSLERIAACWFVFPIALLSVASGKHIRYVVPLLPAMALLAAVELERGVERFRAPLGRALRKPLGWLGLLLGFVGVAAVGVEVFALDASGAPLVWGTALGLLAAAAGAWVFRRAQSAPLEASFLGIYLAVAAGVGMVYSGILPLRPVAARSCPYLVLADEVRAEVGATERLAVVGGRWREAPGSLAPSQLALYLGRWVDDAAFDTLPPDAVVIVPREIAGRPVRRAFDWKEGRREPKERWYVLGPVGKGKGKGGSADDG